MQAAGPQKNLRAITTLWQNVEHFTVNASFAKTGAITELSHLHGEKFSIGQQNSGTEGSGRYLLNHLGIDPDKTLELVYLGYGPSAEALRSGTIKGMNTPGGVPVTAVSQAFAALRDKLVILSFSEEQMQQVNSEYNLWQRFVIPANTYEGQKNAVETIAQPNFLAVRSDVDADTVYLITKTIYENLSFLNNVHKATKTMALTKALNVLPMPLHPGAARYYREAGIAIPEKLVIE
jgi:TRAP transporter TAXI family solute receptor